MCQDLYQKNKPKTSLFEGKMFVEPNDVGVVFQRSLASLTENLF
jgi:hypothetical protein